MSTAPCPTCGQPMPEQPRRDPPLPPLDAPNVVTIHDLPAGERASAKVTVQEIQPSRGPSYKFYRLRTARDVVDGREGR